MGYIEIVFKYIFLIKFSLSRLGEVWNEKIDDGKTPRSVNLRGVTYFANISAKTNFEEKPF